MIRTPALSATSASGMLPSDSEHATLLGSRRAPSDLKQCDGFDAKRVPHDSSQQSVTNTRLGISGESNTCRGNRGAA